MNLSVIVLRKRRDALIELEAPESGGELLALVMIESRTAIKNINEIC